MLVVQVVQAVVTGKRELPTVRLSQGKLGRKRDNSEIKSRERDEELNISCKNPVFQGLKFSCLESLLQNSEEQLRDITGGFPKELISVFLADYNFIFIELSGSLTSSVLTKYISV